LPLPGTAITAQTPSTNSAAFFCWSLSLGID
jgi:hypothetical protein